MIPVNNVTSTTKAPQSPTDPGVSVFPTPMATGVVLWNYNNPVTVELALPDDPKAGYQGGWHWGTPFVQTPQSASFPGALGFRVASTVPGSPAQVVAQVWEVSDGPFPSAGVPLIQQLSSGGSTSLPVSPVNIAHNGAIQSTEPTINLIDAVASAQVTLTWTVVDNPAATRADVTPVISVKSNVLHNGAGAIAEPSINLIDGGGLTWGIVDNPGVSVGITPSFGFGLWTKVADSGVLAGAAASIDFTALPSTFMSYRILYYGRTSGATTATQLGLTFNGDGAANYWDEHWIQTGTTPTLQENANAASISAGALNGTTSTANHPSGGEIIVVNAADTTFFKLVRAISYQSNGAAAASQFTDDAGGTWLNTSAVSRITLTPRLGNWTAGSRAVLYGC